MNNFLLVFWDYHIGGFHQIYYLTIQELLVNIASKSAKIKVNDEIHELNDTLKIKYLEENKKLLLTDGNDTNNESKE